MSHPSSPDDRPDPNEKSTAVRARVPDHIHRGVFSTGAIVMSGTNEFVIDFVQNLGRPFQVVSRVVLPHAVMPQFVDALGKNIELFRQRFGPLPTVTQRSEQITIGPAPLQSPSPTTPLTSHPQAASPTTHNADPANPTPSTTASTAAPGVPGSPNQPVTPPAAGANAPRRLSPQEIYDELKIRDDVLSGCYANAVMIGHGPYEFSFDFITNFFPQSAVSSRVFVSSGQVGLLYDSLKSTWEQFRQRFPGQFPPSSSPGDEPPPTDWDPNKG